MILRRNKRTVPQLNTTSTADISFILLVFFLIMTSMDTDKGLARMLPPANKEDRQETTTDIERSNVLSIRLTAADRLTVDGKACDIGRLREKVTAFVENAADRQLHMINLEVDRQASYDSYFNVQNEIVGAYKALRNKYASRIYGHVYDLCTPEQRETIRKHYPQRIIETTTDGREGGGQ